MTSVSVHIVGGGSGIGRWFAAHAFEGLTVYCYDVSAGNLQSGSLNAIPCLVEGNDFSSFASQFKEGDWVVLAVPLEVFSRVLLELIKVIKPNTLLVCFTSVQAQPLKEMKRIVPENCTYFGCHPLFGHVVSSPAGQIVACARYNRKDLQHVRFLDHLKKIGLIATFLTPAKHDKAMAFIQALTHFSLLGFLKTLEDMTLPLENLVRVKTPNFQFLLAFASRVIKQAPTTLGAVQSTPEAELARGALLNALRGLDNQLEKGNARGCSSALGEMRKRFLVKEEIEEGVEIAALAVDGLQRFDELLLRHKASGAPFVFKHGATRALRVVRVLEIDHNTVRYEEATKKIVQSDGQTRYAVGLTDSARENYHRMGLSCPKARIVKVRKGNVKLLTTAELEEFKRISMIPAETVHTFENKKNFPREFFETILPSLIQGLYKSDFIEKFGSRVFLRLTYDPNMHRDELLLQIASRLTPKADKPESLPAPAAASQLRVIAGARRK